MKLQPRVTLHLLGSPRLERAGQRVEVDTRKAIALMAYLALTRERQGRDKLAALLWSEADDAKAHAALRRTLSVLNKALNGEGLEIEREAISITPEVWVDVEDFHQKLAACHAHGHPVADVCERCLPALTEAVALYRDDFLAGFSLRDSLPFDDWQFFQNESLRRELAGALERLVRGHSERRAFESALGHARRWLALDPLHEPAHRQLMTLYVHSNQHAAALRQYQECVRILRDELGVPPLEETTRLFETIKDSRGTTTPASRRRTDKRAAQPPGNPASLPLVGREAELNALRGAGESEGKFIVLEGEAGIGKTRLAESFLDLSHERGGLTVTARCYEGERNLVYGPFVAALRSLAAQPTVGNRLQELAPHWITEAARLSPELAHLRSNLPSLPPLEGPGAQSRFYEGVLQTLSATSSGTPTVVFFDDLHWADEASLDLLIYIVRRLKGRSLCLLGTWRGEGLAVDHRLRQLLAEAERAGTGFHLSLTRLNETAVAELVQSALGTEQNGQLAERLYRETEGLPLFVVEYLANLNQDAPGSDWSLPAGVRGLLQSRLNQVDEAGKQLLGAAAVLGRSFDFDTLQSVSGRSNEETIAGLEALIRSGLIHELDNAEGGPHYDFNHDKLRVLVYDETSLARRRLLHRRAAQTLAARARGRGAVVLGARASQIALHFRLGGENNEAAQYYQLAGEHARSLYANAEALSHFRSALALGGAEAASPRQSQSGAGPRQVPLGAGLHESIGDLLTLAGDYSAALAAYESAAALSPVEGLGELEHKLGNVYARRGDSELAERHFQAALNTLAESEAGSRARVLADWSLVVHHRGKVKQAQSLAQQSLSVAESAGDQRALAQAHNILGILASSQMDLPSAQHHLEHSLALAERMGDVAAQAAALNNLALAYRTSNQVADAITFAERALNLCVTVGDRHRQAALHNNLADLFHAAAQTEAAMTHLKSAVALFADIGVEAETGTWQPEIWKLAEW